MADLLGKIVTRGIEKACPRVYATGSKFLGKGWI
jgi:hypothetical protein